MPKTKIHLYNGKKPNSLPPAHLNPQTMKKQTSEDSISISVPPLPQTIKSNTNPTPQSTPSSSPCTRNNQNANTTPQSTTLTASLNQRAIPPSLPPHRIRHPNPLRQPVPQIIPHLLPPLMPKYTRILPAIPNRSDLSLHTLPPTPQTSGRSPPSRQILMEPPMPFAPNVLVKNAFQTSLRFWPVRVSIFDTACGGIAHAQSNCGARLHDPFRNPAILRTEFGFYVLPAQRFEQMWRVGESAVLGVGV